jgi:hypothetical protein
MGDEVMFGREEDKPGEVTLVTRSLVAKIRETRLDKGRE